MSEPEKRPAEAKDFLGKPITAGATICYPVRRGSAMWLNKLVVLSVQDTPSGVRVSGTNKTGRRVSIANLENCVVVETLDETSDKTSPDTGE
jgi:hypothetical protein